MAAVLRAGYTCVNVNPLYTPRELAHQLKDSGATVIVILENFAHVLAGVLDSSPVKHVVMAAMGDLLGFAYGSWINFAVRHIAKMVPEYDLPMTGGRQLTPFKKALTVGAQSKLKPSTATLDSIAFLQYTGGTTGLSKGAVLTHRNIIAATLQAQVWFAPALAKVGDVAKVNSIAALPLYHIFALTLCLLTIRQGSHLTLIPNPRWEIFTHGGRKPTGLDAVEWAKKMEGLGAGEILLTSMDQDGMKNGFDLGVTRAISDALGIPVIASGGVGNLQHLADGILEGHASAVLAASIFHFGEYTVPEAKAYMASRGIVVR